MKAELVKRQDRWDLYGEDGSKIASSAPNPFKRLSIKNCEAIANGYDLDELAEKATNKQLIRILGGEDKEEVLDDIQKRKFYFIEGAKAILEILGDKMYTESHMAYMMAKTCEFVENHLDRISSVEFFNNTIKSLQPKEWDVEICCYIGNGDKESDSFKDPLVTNTGIPKLDSDGCLILKRL